MEKSNFDPVFEKILVGIPSYDGNVHPLCMESIKALEAYNNGHSANKENKYAFEIVIASGSSSLFLRNQAAGKGCQKIKQKLPYDYLLSVDSDMQFSVESVIYLVERFKELRGQEKSSNIGALAGAYGGRGKENSHLIVAGGFTACPGDIPPSVWLPYSSKGIREIKWAGTGFLLIAKETLEALEYPWFRAHVIKKGDEASLCTEDVGICMDIAALGKSIWIDCDNRIAHLIH